MSATLTTLAGVGLGISSLISLTPKNSIGGIEIQATLEESHVDRLELTEHPVESGAPITDHSYSRPAEVTLRCGWSNSSTDALLGVATSLFTGGGLSQADYVSGIYSQLLALQQGRTIFAITTGLRQYDNMVITSLQVTRDQKSANALMVQAVCREAIVVSTQTTSLPPQANQANAPSTAQTSNVGSASVVDGSPAPGGSVPSSMWTF